MLGVDPSKVPGDGGVGLRQWLARSKLRLVHRGGLRADVISGGEIRVGDHVEAL